MGKIKTLPNTEVQIYMNICSRFTESNNVTLVEPSSQVILRKGSCRIGYSPQEGSAVKGLSVKLYRKLHNSSLRYQYKLG